MRRPAALFHVKQDRSPLPLKLKNEYVPRGTYRMNNSVLNRFVPRETFQRSKTETLSFVSRETLHLYGELFPDAESAENFSE
jgi:hypothetical protein